MVRKIGQSFPQYRNLVAIPSGLLGFVADLIVDASATRVRHPLQQKNAVWLHGRNHSGRCFGGHQWRRAELQGPSG